MKNWKRIGLAAGIAVAALFVVYLGFSLYFGSHFYFRSTVNGVKAGGASASAMVGRITEASEDYELSVIDAEDKTEKILPEDVDLAVQIGKEDLEELLEKQNGWAWIKYLFQPKDYINEDIIKYDAEKLASAVQGLDCVNNPDATETKDATYAYQKGAYEVVDEVYGTELEAEHFTEMVGDAIIHLKKQLVLDEDGCYKQPKVTADSKELRALVDQMNACLNTVVTYEIGDAQEVVDKEAIASWMSATEKLEVAFNQDLMKEYIKEMGRKYNTYGRAKTLHTSYGATVTVPGGNYGWKIDNEAEVVQLETDLRGGKDVHRDFVYSSVANSHGEQDFGGSYVEINLTAQHLFFYKNGSLVLETDFVSGNPYKGNATPTGAYQVAYKDKDAVLRGENYATPVTYWMPFNGNVGMHDANWRRNFGGSIYKSNGSHGCVNLPVSVAKTIFENVDAGYAVLVYTLGGTEGPSTQDLADAKNVENMINALGPASWESEQAIAGARFAYECLSEEGKKCVPNLQKLIDTEAAMNQIKWDAYLAEEARKQEEYQKWLEQISKPGPETPGPETPGADGTGTGTQGADGTKIE